MNQVLCEVQKEVDGVVGCLLESYLVRWADKNKRYLNGRASAEPEKTRGSPPRQLSSLQ